MRSKQLVSKLKAAAKRLRAAAQWQGSLQDVDSDQNPYIYELLCYFSLALQTHQHFKLKIVPRPHPKTHAPAALWPRGPAKKVNFSYVCLHNTADQCQYELCPGIDVIDRFGQPRAADINLLIPNGPPHPTFQHLCAIWEAKHRQRNRRLSGPEVSDFIVTFEAQGKPSLPASWQQIMPPTFQRSGILTNGKHSTETDRHLQERQISETSAFPDAPVTRP